MYSLDERAIAFLHEIDCDEIMETDNLAWFVKVKRWDAVYQKYMDIFRNWIANDKDESTEQYASGLAANNERSHACKSCICSS